MAKRTEDSFAMESEGALTDTSDDETSSSQPTYFVPRSAVQRERRVKQNKEPEKRGRHKRKRGENNPKNVFVSERILLRFVEMASLGKGAVFGAPS